MRRRETGLAHFLLGVHQIAGGAVFDIRANVRQVDRQLSDIAQRQLPFALALAINDTLADVEKNTLKVLERRLDRPTPFTKRGLYKRRATKTRLVGEIGFKAIQAKYLELQVTGGVRRPKKRAIVVPVGQRLNKYGNMAKGSLARVSRRPDTFSGKVNGVGGIWQRKRGKVKLVAAYEDRARYSKRIKFQEPAHKTSSARLPGHLVRRMRGAMATRR